MAIWDKQNLAGWTQFNIFVALFFVVLMEGLRTLIDANALKVESTTTCVIVGNDDPLMYNKEKMELREVDTVHEPSVEQLI